MTQTDDARGPERIFATGDGVNGSWTTHEISPHWGAAAIEYIRADLATQPDPLADPRVTALLEALTPSGDTKAAYSGEFSFHQYVTDEDGCETTVKVFVPWDTIKQIMAAIRTHANHTAFDTTGGKADG